MILLKIEDLLMEPNFLLILLSEDQYMDSVCDIVRSFEKTKNKICYVCLSKKHADVLCELKKNGIDTDRFIFIDTLSSHYGLPPPENNCIYLYTPNDLDLIKTTMDDIIEKEKCGIFLIDTISDLLSYRETFFILKFAHNLTIGHDKKRIKKLFIALKDGVILENENRELINDLRLFADKVIELPFNKYKSAKNQ